MAAGKSASSKPSFLDLEKQFVFYASYHNNPVNIFIHLLCIWNIAFSAIVLLQYVPIVFGSMPEWIQENFGSDLKVNMALLTCAFYSVVYLIMEPFVGLIGTVLWSLIYYKSSIWVATSAVFYGYTTFQAALGVHIIAWILQFIGHGVFEGRAPALLDSLDQALITAPLFVLMEVAFFFGYRREFHSRIMDEVHKNIAEFKKVK